MSAATIINADARRLPLANKSVHCCICSPPYFGLRDYGTATWEGGSEGCDHKETEAFVNPKNTLGPNGYLPASNAANVSQQKQYRDVCGKCGARRVDRQIGLDASPSEYVAAMVGVFREVKRVLRDDGTLWLNIGDSYNAYNGGAGPGSGFSKGAACDTQRPKRTTGYGLQTKTLKPKDLMGIPWRLAFALQDDGWWLRSDIIWSKPNPMPESVTDRPTKSHEYVFLLTKSERYYWDQEAVRTKGAGSHSRGGASARPGVDINGGNQASGADFTTPESGSNVRSVWKGEAEYLIGVVDGGMSRIASPDCPVHGCPASPAPVQRDGVPRDASPSGRNQRNDVGPLPGQAAFAFSTPEDPSESLSDSGSAKPRSTRIRRMVAESGPDGTCDDTPVSRTGYTGPEIHSDAKSGRIPGSNTSPDASSDGLHYCLSGQTPVRSEDNSACPPPYLKCTCNYIQTIKEDNTSYRHLSSVWVISTMPFKGSHFGTFPPALVERCVKAGTSEKGCCPTCGAPWQRVVERGDLVSSDGRSGSCRAIEQQGLGNSISRASGGDGPSYYGMARREKMNLGWRPSCSCPAHDAIPCTVLDNFVGSGTTGVVATGLGCRFVGVDLSADYCKMAVRRIGRPHARHRTPRKEHHPLFAGLAE